MAVYLPPQQIQQLIAKARYAYYSHCLPSTQFYVQKLVNQNVTEEQQRELLFFHYQSQGACKCCLQRLFDMEKRHTTSEARDYQAAASLQQANYVLTAQLTELQAAVQNSQQPRDYLLEEAKILRQSNEELKKQAQEQARELSYLRTECQRLYKYEQRTLGLTESQTALREQIKAATEYRDDAYRQLYYAKLEVEQLKFSIAQQEDYGLESHKDELIKELRSYIAAVTSKRNAQFEATYDYNVSLKQQLAYKYQRIVYLEQLQEYSKTTVAAALLSAKDEYIQALQAQHQRLQDSYKEFSYHIAKEHAREYPIGGDYSTEQVEELMSTLEYKNQQLCHSNKIILDLQRYLRDSKEKNEVQRSPDNTFELRTTFTESYLEAQELVKENYRLKDAFKVLYSRFSEYDRQIREYPAQIAYLEGYLENAQQIVTKQTEYLRLSLKNQNDDEQTYSTLYYYSKKMNSFVQGAICDLKLMTKVGRYQLMQHAQEAFLLLERTVNYLYKRLGTHCSTLLEYQQNEHSTMVSEMGNYLALSQHTADSSVAYAIKDAEGQTQQIVQKNEEIIALRRKIELLTEYVEYYKQAALIYHYQSAESAGKLRQELLAFQVLHYREIELREHNIRVLYKDLQAGKRRIALFDLRYRKLAYLLGTVLERFSHEDSGTHTLAIKYLTEQFALYAEGGLHFGSLLIAEKKRLYEFQYLRSCDFAEIIVLKSKIAHFEEQERAGKHAYVCLAEKLKSAEQRAAALEERAVYCDRLKQSAGGWYLSLTEITAGFLPAKEASQRARRELSIALQAEYSKLEYLVKSAGNKMAAAFSKQRREYEELLTDASTDLETARSRFSNAENTAKTVLGECNALRAQLQKAEQAQLQLAEELQLSRQGFDRQQRESAQLEGSKARLEDELKLETARNAELSVALAYVYPLARRLECELQQKTTEMKTIQEEMQSRDALHEKALYRCSSDCEEKQKQIYRLTAERDEVRMQQQAQAAQTESAIFRYKQAEGQIMATYELERHNSEFERQICEAQVAKQLLMQYILLLEGRIYALGYNIGILVNSTNQYTEKKFATQLGAFPRLEGDLQRHVAGLLPFAYELEQLVFGYRAHIAEILLANRRVTGEFAQALRERQNLGQYLEALQQQYAQQQKLVYKQTYELEAQKSEIQNFVMTLEKQKNSYQKQKELLYQTKDLQSALSTKDRQLGLLGSKIYALQYEIGEKHEQLNYRYQQFYAYDIYFLRVENDFYYARDNLRYQIADNDMLKQQLPEYQRQVSVLAEQLATATSYVKQMGHENQQAKAELERSRDLLRAQGDELARLRSLQP